MLVLKLTEYPVDKKKNKVDKFIKKNSGSRYAHLSTNKKIQIHNTYQQENNKITN